MLKTHMAACLVATMFAAPAFAQAPASPSTSGSPSSSTTAPATPGTAPSTTMPSSSAMSGKFMTKIETGQMMASELIGTKVISANNESIGDINDVIVDRKGQAVAAVVGVGGFLGIGEKDVAVPFSALEFATREQVSAMGNVSTTGSTTTTTTGTTAPSTTGAPATSGTTATADDEPERVILRMTKAELQAAPAFDTERDATTTGTTTGTTAPRAPAAPAQKP